MHTPSMSIIYTIGLQPAQGAVEELVEQRRHRLELNDKEKSTY